MADSQTPLTPWQAAGAWLGSTQLRVGDPAPAFELPGTDGNTHALDDHLGQRWVSLAWFPRASTPG